MVPLIDTHLHLIYPEAFKYSWIDQVPALQRPFKLEDYTELTKEHGIAASLCMEVDVEEEDSLQEAHFFAEKAADPQSILSGVIASARPEKEDFAHQLASLSSTSLKGIRRVLHVVDDATSQSPVFRENIRLLANYQLPFDLCILQRQHSLGLDLIDACPNTRFVLDHCGNPDLADPAARESWQEGLKKFAERPNVFAKLSGIVVTSPEKPATLAMVKPYLDATLEAFGPTRVLWGSDWPVCTLTTGLVDWIEIFRSWLSAFSEDEQNLIAHKNAVHCYRLSKFE